MADNFSERRHYPRREYYLPMTFSLSQMGEPRRANLLNLSLGGLALETNEVCVPGSIYLFSVRLEGEEITLPGRIAWDKVGKNIKICGVEFLEIPLVDKFRLHRLI